MSNEQLAILLPPGRMVWGDLYTGASTDWEGKPRLTREGKPKVTFDFGIAIPKNGTTHWNQTAWGKQIWDYGVARWPQGQYQKPDFAWKIKDGDSTIPTASGRRPVDNPGYAGHWIVGLSSTIAPRIYRLANNGPVLWEEKDAVKPGDWIEANISINSNENLQKPGIYLNHGLVCFRGYDPAGRIVTGPAPESVGFGQALPAGVSSAPGGQALGAPASQAITAPATPTVQTVNPPAYAPPALAVAAPPAPPVPQAPSAPVGPVMTPKANGMPYEAFIAAGWNDEQLRAQGYLA